MGDTIETLAQTGLNALKQGDPAAARRAFEAVAAAGRASPRLYLLLAEACARLKDVAAQREALDRVLALEPRNIAALTLRGDNAMAGGDDRAAAAFYGMALSSAALMTTTAVPEFAAYLTRAEAGLTEARQRFDRHLRDALAGVAGGARFDEALAIVSGHAEPQLQAPTSFYYPGLPQTAFYDRHDFAWVAGLEAATPAIHAELEAVLATCEGFRPYVEADPTRPNRGHALLDNGDWSAFHLYEGGQPVPHNAARCPATMAALDKVPLPHIAERSPMALFSLLKPHTHIPPHNGMLNTRLIVHLPLIVPPACRLRVGNHVHGVEAGKAMIFDDSIQHEAWNDSDETRVVLLFEIWRPELAADERAALTRMFEAIGSYGS